MISQSMRGEIDGDDLKMIAVTIGGVNGLNLSGYDFVYELSQTVSGAELEDVDNDNDGDIPTPVVTLSVIDSSGDVVATTLTDTNGEFPMDDPRGLSSTRSSRQDKQPRFCGC